MQWRLLPAAVERTAPRLAVDGYDLSLAGCGNVPAQCVKQDSKARGPISMNTRRNVSWEGMPLGQARNWRNHGN